jgi:thiopurine S-methyltransferase
MNADRDEWRRIYQDEGTPWDLDEATPALPEILEAARRWGLPVEARVAVPGCGLGHDAAALAVAGFRVCAIDPVAHALQAAQARYGAGVAWMECDWFEGKLGPFDAVFDHAFFVAFEPARRMEVVAAHAAQLNPGGLWLGLYWHRVKGPDIRPWAIQPGELEALAQPHFEVLQLTAAQNSHPRRVGREFWMIARRRAKI